MAKVRSQKPAAKRSEPKQPNGHYSGKARSLTEVQLARVFLVDERPVTVDSAEDVQTTGIEARATFFVLGEAAQQYPKILRRMQDEHHQIGSHTYSHSSLPTPSHDAIVAEMTRLEDVLVLIIKEILSYMRPPYFDVSAKVLATMSELGYKVITASIDTKDYKHNNKVGINISYKKFLTKLDTSGSIFLAHDIHYWTRESLLERMLIEISDRGLRLPPLVSASVSRWTHGTGLRMRPFESALPQPVRTW
ncbi:hypothetical protein BJX64DRAFT_289611 [Aspergillus heterothallicus]